VKVQIMSDIHLGYPRSLGFPPLAPGVGLVIIGGDTCEGLVRALHEARRAYPKPVEIAAIAGNHEFYGKCYPDELAAGRTAAESLGIHFLENDVAYFGSLRVLGCTLWTSYDLFGPALRAPAMRAAYDNMSDHKRIKWQKNPWMRFRPEESALLHARSRHFIETELSKVHPGETILVTHHAITLDQIAPAHQRSILSAAYATELLVTVETFQPAVWVTGHTHHQFNERRGRTRLISNPYGYAGENRLFDPQFTIEVSHD
jgi:predicted phosphodiesterase